MMKNKKIQEYLEKMNWNVWEDITTLRKLSEEKGMPFITRTAWKNDATESERREVENMAINRSYG